MTLYQLSNILGERIELLDNRAIPMETRQSELEISQTISSLAKQMINAADVILRAEKLVSDGKLNKATITHMIDLDGNNVER